MCIFQYALTKLQTNDVLIIDVLEIMNSILQSFVKKKDDAFYGRVARRILVNCTDDQWCSEG